MTEADALALLRETGIANARREVELLKRVASLECDAGHDGGEKDLMPERFAELVKRRAAHEPISHLTGRRAFWNHEFHVSSAVLDPRPDTETLVEEGLKLPFKRLLDLGTGSGCILLSLLAERPEAIGLGTDISLAALDIAAQNRALLELEARAELRLSDWFSAVEERFDLITSNPPYIDAKTYTRLDRGVRDYEPRIALSPGGDGLDAYRSIIGQAGTYLTPGGFLLVEIGHDQRASVTELFEKAGFVKVTATRDLNSKDRVISGSWPE